jgi:hypothetical protein
MQKPINVNGRKVNKLEEIVRLLAKLNEDHYTEEEREKEGYPIIVTVRADGSGDLCDGGDLSTVYRFNSLSGLESFLKANRRQQLMLSRVNCSVETMEND